MNVSLPPSLKRWVDEQAESQGYQTASEFVRDVLRQASALHLQERIDPMLIEAMESGATIEMNDADWQEIRRTARATAKRAQRQKRT
jgi:antitoxin ParD1/3/4